MKKLTQRDLCVLYLSQHGGWVKVCELKGKPYKDRFLGSESDRRMIEVMKDVKEKGYYEVNGYRYVIEESSEGKYKTYRVLNPKKNIVYVLEFLPDGSPIRRPKVELV